MEDDPVLNPDHNVAELVDLLPQPPIGDRLDFRDVRHPITRAKLTEDTICAGVVHHAIVVKRDRGAEMADLAPDLVPHGRHEWKGLDEACRDWPFWLHHRHSQGGVPGLYLQAVHECKCVPLSLCPLCLCRCIAM